MSIPAILIDDEQLRNLAMAVARNRVGPNDPIEEVLAMLDISPQEFMRVADDAVFKRYVTGFVKEFTENGVSFSSKCRVLAEDAIQDLYYLAKDGEQPAAARVKAVENLVDWAGLAPKNLPGDAASTRPTFSITINLPKEVSDRPMTITGVSELVPITEDDVQLPEIPNVEDGYEHELLPDKGGPDPLAALFAA